MKLTALLIFALATKVISQSNYSISTSPPSEEGKDTYVVVDIGATIDIICNITSYNPIVVDIQWTLVNATDNTIEVLAFKVDGTADLFPFLSTSNPNTPTKMDLTLTDFAIYMDRMQLKCADAGNNVGATFVLGIQALPTLIVDEIVTATEGDGFKFSGILPNSEPFPPDLIVTYVWSKQDTELTSDSAVSFSEYDITIDPVRRDHHGNYTLMATNHTEMLTTIGSFYLDVLFFPTGIKEFDKINKIVRLGMAVTLPTGYTDIMANPPPDIVWFNNNDTQVSKNHTSFVQRYEIDESYQLVINNVTEEDIGTFIFGVINEIVETMNPNKSLFSFVELIKATPPGPPTELNASIDNDLQIILNWAMPSDVGIPALTHYRVIINSADNPFFNNVPLPSETELEKYNSTTGIISNLFPGTIYYLSVEAVSELFPGGGMDSQIIPIELPLTGPRIQKVLVGFSGGKLNVVYELLHTGGYHWDNVTVTIACDIYDDLNDNTGFGVIMMEDYTFYYDCATECFHNSTSLRGAYSFISQSVYAGMDYLCLVIANNSASSDIDGVNATATEGIPSVPIIRNIQSNRNSSAARLSVITEYVGVPSDDDSFKFIVYYVAQESSTNEQMSEFPFPHYNESAVVDLTINNLSAGRYTFSVVARNKYGNSHRSDPEELTVTTDPPPTTTSRPTSTMQPTRSPAPIGAIVGGVIGGLVFLVAVAVTAAIAIVCYIKKFTGRATIEKIHPI